MTSTPPEQPDPAVDPVPAAAEPMPGAGPDDGAAPDGSRPLASRLSSLLEDRRALIALIAIIAALGIIAAYLVGTAIGASRQPEAAISSAAAESTPSPAPTPTQTPTPVPTVAVAPAGPVAPGTWAWDELGGRECIEPYSTPWAEEFVVVPCTDPHHGQLVARASFSDDPAAPYPGEAALVSQLGLLCSAPAVIDYGRAGTYSDVQLQASYPPDEQSWARGERSYYCFASLAGGGALTDTIAVG